MHYLFSRPDSLAEKAKQLLEKVSTEESIQRGDSVHIKSSGKLALVLGIEGNKLRVKSPGHEAQILSVDEVELFQDYDESTELEESTKVEKLSDLSDDEKARIEDILTRRDKNMPDGMKNRKRHPILMFDKNGQYHGSYASVSDAEKKIERVGDTEGWINGPRLVQVDESRESVELEETDAEAELSKALSATFDTAVGGDDDAEYSSDELKVLKGLGFEEAPIGKSTYDSSKGVKVLYGLPLRGGKWLNDAWVGEYDNGTYFMADLEGVQDFNKSADLIKHLKKVALGESTNLSDAEKLKIFADNNNDLYKRSAVPVMQNLTRKFKKGIYDHELAKKLWKYHADRAAKAYGKEHGNDGFAIFSPAIRKEVAAEFADDFQVELEAGNFHEGVSVQKMLDAEDRETGKFHSMSDMTLAFDENPEGSTSQLGDGVLELDGFNAAGWQHLDGKYAVRVGGGYQIYTDLEAAKAYAKDDFEEGYKSDEIQEGKKVSSLVWGVFAQTLLSKIEPKEVKKAQELLKIWGKWKDKFTDKDIADLIDKLKTWGKPKDGYFLFAIDEIGKIAAAYDEPKADWYKKK